MQSFDVAASEALLSAGPPSSRAQLGPALAAPAAQQQLQVACAAWPENTPPCCMDELLSAGATWPRGRSSAKLRSAQTGQWSLPSHSGQMSAPVNLSSTVSCSREGRTSSSEAVHNQPRQPFLPCRNQQVMSRWHARPTLQPAGCMVSQRLPAGFAALLPATHRSRPV